MRFQSLLLIAGMAMTSFGFSQNQKQNDNQVHIKIDSDDGERVISIDTSFNFTGDPKKLHEFLKQFNLDNDVNFNWNDGNIEIYMQKGDHGDKHRNMVIIGGDDEDAQHAFLGVFITDPNEGEEAGAHVTEIIEGTAAEKAGLKAGDIITKANGEAVANKDELIQMIQSMKPEDQMSITYLRDGKKQRTTATLGAKKHEYNFSYGWPGMSGHNNFMWNQDDKAIIESNPYLGVYVDDQEDGNGVVITNIESESAAQAAGLQEGDVITGIDGTTITTSQALIDAIRSHEIGDEITVTYKREGQTQTARATLGEKKMTDRHAFFGRSFKGNDDLRKQIEEMEKNLDQYDKEELRQKLEEMKDQLDESHDHSFFFSPDKNVDFNKMVIIIEMDDVSESEAAQFNLSTENNLEAEDLSFSPNPGDGRFNLSFTLPDAGDATINIMDINGRTVYQEELSDFSGKYNGQIDISGEAKGVYFLQLVQNDKSLVKKIMIQ